MGGLMAGQGKRGGGLTTVPWPEGWRSRFFNTDFQGEATDYTERGGSVRRPALLKRTRGEAPGASREKQGSV